MLMLTSILTNDIVSTEGCLLAAGWDFTNVDGNFGRSGLLFLGTLLVNSG